MDWRKEMTAFIIICLLVTYWAPSIIAGNRNHNDKWSIFLLNLFFGWTLALWFVALLWSASGNVMKKVEQ